MKEVGSSKNKKDMKEGWNMRTESYGELELRFQAYL